jgi:serpin B
LHDWLARAHPQKINVFLPRFKLTAEFNLGRTLAAMGMGNAFSPAADFSGMDGARDLCISAVVHKAFVEVNEEGTEAAAATGTIMKMLAVRPHPTPTFRADHPFLLLIRDIHSGSILFLGRVLDPTQGSS